MTSICRSKSSGKKKKLEKSFSTESALNYLGDYSNNEFDESREPSPTKVQTFKDFSCILTTLVLHFCVMFERFYCRSL